MIVFFFLEVLFLHPSKSSFLKKRYPCPLGHTASDIAVHSDFDVEAKRAFQSMFTLVAQLTSLTVLIKWPVA
jgi:hypothetical protein